MGPAERAFVFKEVLNGRPLLAPSVDIFFYDIVQYSVSLWKSQQVGSSKDICTALVEFKES